MIWTSIPVKAFWILHCISLISKAHFFVLHNFWKARTNNTNKVHARLFSLCLLLMTYCAVLVNASRSFISFIQHFLLQLVIPVKKREILNVQLYWNLIQYFRVVLVYKWQIELEYFLRFVWLANGGTYNNNVVCEFKS